MNGWVDTDDFVMGRGFGKEGAWGLVESGLVDWDDERVRFRNKVGYGAGLGLFLKWEVWAWSGLARGAWNFDQG